MQKNKSITSIKKYNDKDYLKKLKQISKLNYDLLNNTTLQYNNSHNTIKRYVKENHHEFLYRIGLTNKQYKEKLIKLNTEINEIKEMKEATFKPKIIHSKHHSVGSKYLQEKLYMKNLKCKINTKCYNF